MATVLLADFFDTTYLPLKLRSRSANTIRLYRHTVASFSRWLGRPATLEDLTDDAVSAYLASLNARGLSPYTVNKERSQLLAIWNYAARKKFVPVFPDVAPETLPKRVPQAWTVEDLSALLDACHSEPGTISGVPAADWWVSLHLVIYDTAERIGAVLELRWGDYQPPWLLIPAESRKGRRADKLHKLGADTQSALARIRPPDRDLIWPWPRTQHTLYYHYNRILRRAGLPHDGRCKFHRLRRTVASYYEAACGNASQLLGHTSRRTTEAYLDPRIVRTAQPCDLLRRLR